MSFKEYLLQNWPLILILLAFLVSLISTVFLKKQRIIRYCFLIGAIFILSITVYIEFSITDREDLKTLRLVLMAMRYSATPIIIAQVVHALVKKMTWIVFIPAIVLTIMNVISIFNGMVFSIGSDNKLCRGPIGFIPFVVVGLYSVVLIYLLIRNSNKRLIEFVSISFLVFALGSGMVLPFIYGDDYAAIFCVTIAIALFAYFEFSMLELTKKDSLTGLLNRHAYYADVSNNIKSITALVSIDMNGLKNINDNIGHAAGDEALTTLSHCFNKAIKFRQSVYRTGGDEFVIVCRRCTKQEVLQLVERIKQNVSATKYSCSIGYSFNFEGDKSIDQLLTESDEMMYQEKDRYYQESGQDRRII